MRTGHILSLTLTSLIILTGCQIKQGGDIATQALPASSIQGQHSQTYTYRLDNGLQVILWPNSNSHSRNEASLDLVIHSGSLHEKDNQLGYAHFVEHMLFNQSKANGDNPVFDALHELNLNLSNHANAYTTFGHTRYYLDLPNASHKRLTKAIELLSLFAYQAAFDCQEVAKEMGVIREEWRLSEPEKQTYQYQRQQLDLANSRYLTRLPIGNLDSIESATPAALQDYYQQHYHPGNATLIITGDIDIDKVATSIADSFDDWPDANKGRAKVYAKPPMRPPSLDIFEDAKEPAYFVWIGNSYANPLATDKATEFANFKLELITDLLHERLKKLATQQSNSLRDFSAGVYDMEGDFVDVGISFRSQYPDLETGIKLMGSVISDLKNNGFTQIELDNIRNQILQNERAQQDSAAHLSNIATSHVVHNLWLSDQKHYLGMLEKHLPQLTLSELQELAKEIFTSPFKIELGAKPNANMPTETKLRNWLTAGQQTTLAPTSTQAASQVINWHIKHPPGNITKQQKFNNGIHALTLSNGIKVHYRYSDSTPGKFYMKMLTAGGFNRLNPQEIINTRLGLVVMGASGLQSLDGHQLRNWLEGQALSLQPEFTINNRGLTLDGPSDKVETLLQLLHVALQDGRIDAAIYDHYMPQFKQEIHDLNTLDYKDYIHQVDAHISQGNPAYRSLSIDEIQSAKAADMHQIYQQYIAGAQNYVLHIVGDITLAQLQPHLEAYIASLPEQGQTLTPKPSPKWPGDATIIGNNSNNKAAIVSYNLQLQQPTGETTDYAQAEMLSNLLGMRLNAIIREDLGLTYHISSEIYQTYPEDPMQVLAINLECDPAQVENVLATIDNTLTELTAEGFSQATINQQLKVMRGDFINSRHQAKFILWELANAQLLNLDLASLLDPEAAYPNIKATTIDAMLKTLVNNHHSRTVFVLNP